MFHFWNKIPKWLKDSISVTLFMTILLIIYDIVYLLLDNKPTYIKVVIYFPFQVILAFIFVSFYNWRKLQYNKKKQQVKLEEGTQLASHRKKQHDHHLINTKRNFEAAKKQHRANSK